MILSHLLIGALLSLTNQAVASTCFTQETCTITDISSTKPKSTSGAALPCGVKGHLRWPSPVAALPSCKASNLDTCSSSCINTPGCVTFRWTAANSTCALYSKYIGLMGYTNKTNDHGSVFYNRNCFTQSCTGLVQNPSFEDSSYIGVTPIDWSNDYPEDPGDRGLWTDADGAPNGNNSVFACNDMPANTKPIIANLSQVLERPSAKTGVAHISLWFGSFTPDSSPNNNTYYGAVYLDEQTLVPLQPLCSEDTPCKEIYNKDGQSDGVYWRQVIGSGPVTSQNPTLTISFPQQELTPNYQCAFLDDVQLQIYS